MNLVKNLDIAKQMFIDNSYLEYVVTMDNNGKLIVFPRSYFKC